MASIGQKLETKGVIMTLLSLVLIGTGCEERINSSVVNPSEGKTVEVTLNIGIADEEDGTGASASPTSKAGCSSYSGSAFEVVSVADVQTKSGMDIPDQLYNLEIWQYNESGNKIGGEALGNVTIGSTFTASLTLATGCKLLLVARGASTDFESLSGKTLSAVQDLKVEAKKSNINKIATNATGNGLANMTYYLLLENVNITSDGKIESPTGKDVRLLLKRLAVKVQLDWTFAQEMTNKGYTLKEVKLCQVPAHYRLVPQTEKTDKWGDVYPSSVAEFVDLYRLTGTELTDAKGTQTVWIPANARGISPYSNSPYYRNKTNANPVIAAYSGSTIVWSWHLWITDYVPARINSFSEYATAQISSSKGTVHKYDSPLFQEGGVYAAKVMMDRDLGARKGGFPGITIGDDFTVMDAVNTFGLLYQWGRKDPFFPSADGTNKETDIIYDGDGFSTGVVNIKAQVSMSTAIANPSTFYYYSNGIWNTESGRAKFWNADGGMAPGKKTIYDPCPKGWKIPNLFASDRTISVNNIQINSIYTNFGKTSNGDIVNSVQKADYSKFLYYYNNWYGSNTSVPDNNNPKGGRLFLIGDASIATKTIHNSVWVSANAERHCINNGKLSYAGKYGHIWGADAERYYMGFHPTMVEVNIIANSAYGWPVRCIQE